MACYDRATSTFGYLTHTDRSDASTRCVKVADVVEAAKFAYYAARLLILLGA